MPHQVGARWSGAARHATAFALLVVIGCGSDEATLLVMVTQGPASAVIASPVDPRSLRGAVIADSRASPLARAMARYYATADSADSLDHAFQRERAVLNSEARKLARADRRAPAYARDYDAFMGRVTIATRTREARDRARRRAAALRTQLGTHAPDPASRDPRGRYRTALDSAARTKGQRLIGGAVRNGRATLTLPPGIWWILVEHDGGLLSLPRRHEARRGARDTLRIGA